MNSRLTRNAHSRSFGIAASILTICLLGSAQGVQAQSSLVSAPWFAGVSGGVAAPESLRQISPGTYARVFMGIPLRPQAYIETSVFAAKLPGKNNQSAETTLGLGLDLHLESLGAYAKYVFLAGGGYSRAQRDNRNIYSPFINIGYGIELPLTDRIGLRPEVRGFARLSNDFIDGRGVTYDAALSMGLTYAFGALPKTAESGRIPAAAGYAPASSAPIETAALPAAASVPEPSKQAPPAEPIAASRVFAGGPCPQAPAGAVVNAGGCLTAQNLILARSLFFQAGALALSPGADPVLLAIAAAVFHTPTLNVEVVVHTDSLGYEEDNLTMTANMAEELREELLALGVPDGRLQTSGRGESQPRASEDTDAGVEKNRRVEFFLRHR